jgi:hypothetical protein
MTTVGDAIKDALDANWAGSGGAKPALYSSEDVGKEWPTDPDWIKVLGWTYRRKRRRRNDTFIGERYLIDLLAHSMNDANSEERLDTIVTEIYRIINPTNVTGFNDVDTVEESRAASDDYMHFMATLTVELTIKSTAAAVTPGSGGDGDVVFPADVDIAGDLVVDGTSTLTGAVTTGTDATIGGDLTVSGGDVTTPGSMALNTVGGGTVIRLKPAGVETVYVGPSVRFFTDVQLDNDVLTQSDKSADVGATGTAWDNMYADDYVNESPFKKFDKPLDKIKKIKDKDGRLDYKSLPDWLRATKRINQVVEIDEEGNKTVVDVGEKVVAERGFSINRMCILLYQALQEATARIETLEAR